MGKPKKHHYVPKAYLRFFAQQNGDKYTLYVFDKVSNQEFTSNINDVAEIRNYNKVLSERFIVPPPNGDPLYYEYKYINLIEGEIPQILNNLIATCVLSRADKTVLTEESKRKLAKLLIIQLLRTPQSRTRTFELGKPIVDSVMQKIQDQIIQISDTKRREEFLRVLNEFNYTSQFSTSVHLQATTDEKKITDYAQRLVSHRSWAIWENRFYPFLPFVTSDHPVVMYNLQNHELGFGSNSIENPATVISMPLTPKYMISLYHKNSLWGYYSQSYEDRCFPISEVKFIQNQNLLQAWQCSRQIYTTPIFNNSLIDFKKVVM